MDEEYSKEPQEHIHQFGDDPEESDSFVTKDQHDNFVTQEDEGDQEPIENEAKDSHTAYINALSKFNRQYDLRNRSVGLPLLRRFHRVRPQLVSLPRLNPERRWCNTSL